MERIQDAPLQNLTSTWGLGELSETVKKAAWPTSTVPMKVVISITWMEDISIFATVEAMAATETLRLREDCKIYAYIPNISNKFEACISTILPSFIYEQSLTKKPSSVKKRKRI